MLVKPNGERASAMIWRTVHQVDQSAVDGLDRSRESVAGTAELDLHADEHMLNSSHQRYARSCMCQSYLGPWPARCHLRKSYRRECLDEH